MRKPIIFILVGMGLMLLAILTASLFPDTVLSIASVFSISDARDATAVVFGIGLVTFFIGIEKRYPVI